MAIFISRQRARKLPRNLSGRPIVSGMVSVALGLVATVAAFLRLIAAELVELDDVPVRVADKDGRQATEAEAPCDRNALGFEEGFGLIDRSYPQAMCV